MPLQCNIDARGKAVRLVYGVFFLLAGIGLILFWARVSGSVLAWVVGICLSLGGAFMIFEARKGWCVVRAMGFKTRI